MGKDPRLFVFKGASKYQLFFCFPSGIKQKYEG